MIFDIEQIYEEGLDFEVLESKDQFNLDSPDLILMKDVRAQGRLEKSGQSIFCDGSLQTELSATCTRCLGSCSYIVSVKLNIHFIPRVENKISSDEIELTATDVEQVLTIPKYTFIENCYKISADVLGLTPLHLQSITWQAWKRMKASK